MGEKKVLEKVFIILFSTLLLLSKFDFSRDGIAMG